ncbi:hypothetical protein CBR_g24149 [Chara braunii]|uniref:CCHC-type domain-containing protein n=1 Tax=Chara braunii TaxID=69332 RepID=A0A388L637_CHABU|nr:hypothetical protein CBR_g24149 [Chara braunii]|eukprot:GBG77702.1 hypothetical protein CBR_g24149 [Chara braunii]
MANTNRGCFNCGEHGHWSRECPHPQRLGYRPSVATGANAEPILALPASGTASASAQSVAPAATTHGLVPRTGWWTRNQQILDKCNDFVSKAQQKEREEWAAKEEERKKREKEEEELRRKKEREDLEKSMGQTLESRLAPMYEAIMGKGAACSNPNNKELVRLRRENMELRAKFGIKEQLPTSEVVDQLQRENVDLKRQEADSKLKMEGELAALKWEIRELKECRGSAMKNDLANQVEELRREVQLLRKHNDETKEVAWLWRNEALCPGNKRGSINVATPSSEGRACTKSRSGGEGSTPRGAGTNLKERMDEAAKTGFQSGRRGRVKMTSGRLPRPSDNPRKANDRFVLLQDERKRLKGLKKKGLEALCQEEGIQYQTVDSMAEELAQLYINKMFSEAVEKENGGGTGQHPSKAAAEASNVAEVAEVPSDSA